MVRARIGDAAPDAALILGTGLGFVGQLRDERRATNGERGGEG